MKLDKCPFCGCEEYYTRDYARGTVRFIQRFDGEVTDNSEMYDSVYTVRYGKYAYCLHCHKRLFKIRNKEE